MNTYKFFLSAITISTIFCMVNTVKANDVSRANNPLANIKSLSISDYYAPSLNKTEGYTNQLYLRYSQPIGRVLMRASLPFITTDIGNKHSDGIGDIQIFGAYLFSDPEASVQYGAGPLLVIPTGDEKSGTKRWQGGLSAVAFNMANPRFQYGALVTWQKDFAGSGTKKTDLLGIQPFLMYQLGGGNYIRSTPIWSFDLDNGGVNIPLSLGFGKVTTTTKHVFNYYIETQYSVYSKDFKGSPKFQVMAGLNIQFK